MIIKEIDSSIYLPVLGSFIMVFIGFNLTEKQIFEYKSKEGILMFRNKNITGLTLREEYLPTYLIRDFKIKEYPLKKKLYIKQSIKRSLVSYDITYLSNENRQKLILEIEHIVKMNTFIQ